MKDDDLIEQAMNLPLIYCDNFGAFREINGLLRCVGYVIQGGATLNLACSLSGAEHTQQETHRILRASASKPIYIRDWSAATH